MRGHLQSPPDRETVKSSEGPDRLGPQLDSESGLPRRMRLHQSWWRADVLGLREWGHLPRGGRHLGSMLTDRDGAAGHNFLTVDARSAFDQRRREGWGVDPERCTKNLMSSQTLTFNMLGPLESDRRWGAGTIRSITGIQIQVIEAVHFEYAPRLRSQHLNDQTRADCLLIYRDESGRRGILVVETKLSDRFSTRRIPIETNRRYQAVAEALGLWLDDSLATTPRTNQLLRCHALAGSVTLAERMELPPILWLIHHSEDAAAREVSEKYKSSLAHVGSFMTSTIFEVSTALESEATIGRQRNWARLIGTRYGSLAGSSHLCAEGR